MTSEEQAQPAQLPVAPHTVRTAALAELDRLTALVQSLSLEDWEKPNACGDWSVGDVVAHLNLVLGLHRRLIGAVIGGKGSGSVWKTMGQLTKRLAPAASPALSALNSALPRVIDRALAPEVVKGQFASTARGLRETLSRVDSADYTRPVYYRGGPWPLSFFLALLVNELAIHGWDIAIKLDPQAHLGEEARAVLPSFFWSGTPFMLKMPKGITGTIQASLTDPTVELWWTIKETETVQGMGQSAAPDATLRGASGTFVLALAGRLRPEDTLGSTSLQATGRDELARAFLTSWRNA